MDNPINRELISLLACPNCGGDLLEAKNRLKCSLCYKEYEITNGIPILYPDNTDVGHLREEENLAGMMRQPRLSQKEQFSLSQWSASKQEFWEMVRSNIEPPPKCFVNIGCGFDSYFVQFEEQAYIFVNFDIVYDVYALTREHGTKSCIAGDISSLPFKRSSFDYIVSIDVIHHESDKVFALLESFRNLLKPGGCLFLEDPNAWGMFQLAKSIILPKPLYRFLRSAYHRLKRSAHRPADYEFPTSVWSVRKMLRDLGFRNIRVYPNNAYPCIGETSFQIYKLFKHIDWVRKYHNYHYMLSAERAV
jgi:SAM-dependent methyltransferase